MDDLNFVKDLVDKLDGVIALNINPHSENGKATLDALSESEVLLVVSASSDIQPNLKGNINHRLSRALNNTKQLTKLEDSLHQLSGSPKIDIANLTSREMQVLELLTVGLSNKLIGRELNICHSTVKVHVKNILHKLKKHSRLEAAIWAVDNLKHTEFNKRRNREEHL
ncbi:MAG: hypothetical protein GKR92_01065 [Gammaproteobacteria bacterium]|nr:MAG: hypothetical protein GKR92_01065 [Gammaproteobacteria bacterium]